jgi:hypothetical protein
MIGHPSASASAREASTFAMAVATDDSRVTPGSGAASPIALGIHFVAQQALCNALGASGLHWVWAIALRLGHGSLFRTGESRLSAVTMPEEIDVSFPSRAVGLFADA